MSYPLLSSLNPGGQPARPSRAVVPNLFGTIHLEQWSPAFLAPETCFFFFFFFEICFLEDSFSMVYGEGGGYCDDSGLYLLCALFLYDISSTSDHQALIRSRRLGPLLWRDDCGLHRFMVPSAVFSLQPSGHASI